jgi:hypothetical protein
MALRGIAPLCIFCITCIISVGIACIILDGTLGDVGVADDAAAGGVVSVCWWASCASADVACAIPSRAVAQKGRGMDASFMTGSLVAKNMGLLFWPFRTPDASTLLMAVAYDVPGLGWARRSAMNWSNSALSFAVRRRNRKSRNPRCSSSNRCNVAVRYSSKA